MGLKNGDRFDTDYFGPVTRWRVKQTKTLNGDVRTMLIRVHQNPIPEGVACKDCCSVNLYRHGFTAAKVQRYKCRDCGRNSRESPQHEKYTSEQKETILRAYQERSSMRGIQRIFGVTRPTLSAWLKKRPGVASANEPSEGAGGDTAAP